jgi:hypothetical protein
MASPPELTPQSMVMVQVGGRAYPLRSEPTCGVCQSPYRFEIERALVLGESYGAILESMADRQPVPPSRAVLIAHVKNMHMPLPQATQRKLIEKRAADLGKDIEEATESLLDYASVNETIIKKGFERLQDGDIRPSMGDLLKALTLQAQIEAATPSGHLDTEAWQAALMEYFKIARRMMPPELWAQFTGELARSPILKAINGQQQTVSGQVVE